MIASSTIDCGAEERDCEARAARSFGPTEANMSKIEAVSGGMINF